MQLRDDESGQSLIFATLFFAVLIAFTAVLVDGGTYMWEHRNLQGAADAAALAGVRELPDSTALADSVARDYATSQNSDGATVASLTITGGNTIKVDLEKEVPGAFMAVFGVSAPTINATATARASYVTSLPGMLPFGMLEGQYEVTNPATNTPIGDAGNNKNGLLWPESGPQCESKNQTKDLITGDVTACAMSPGDIAEGQTGWAGGTIKGPFEDRLAGNTQSFDDVFEWDPDLGKYIVLDPDSPRIGIIPIVVRADGESVWAKKEMTIVGYALAYIGDTTDSPTYRATGDGDGKTIYLSPVDAVFPEDWEAETDEDDAVAGSPAIYRLTE